MNGSKKSRGGLVKIDGKIISKTHLRNSESFEQALGNMGNENECGTQQAIC